MVSSKTGRQERCSPEDSLIDLNSDGELRSPMRVPKPDGERKRNMRRRLRYSVNTRHYLRTRSSRPLTYQREQRSNQNWRFRARFNSMSIFEAICLVICIGIISIFLLIVSCSVPILGLLLIAIFALVLIAGWLRSLT